MLKQIFAQVVIVVSITSPGLAMPTSFVDEFNDTTIDPAWIQAAEGDLQSVHVAESGGRLAFTQIIDSDPHNSVSARYLLSQPLDSVGDFEFVTRMSFDSGNGNAATRQGINVRLAGASGTVVGVGYSDVWTGHRGGVTTGFFDDGTSTASNHQGMDSQGFQGTFEFSVTRIGDDVSMLVNGSPFLNGTTDDLITDVVITGSTFGNFNGDVSVDFIRLTGTSVPTPSTFVMLSSLGYFILRRNKHH